LNIFTTQKLVLPALFTLVIGINVVLVCGCKKYAVATPAFFIKSSSVSVVTTSSLQGSSSNKITELFLYVNGKFQGAYPNGNLMPIASNNQNVKIDVLAGIKNNGFKATHISWIFYDKIEIDTFVQSGITIERPLTFKYNPNVKFAWVEGFENTTGQSVIKSGVSSVNFSTVSSPESFEGKSIKMELTQNETIAQIESALSYSLPTGSSNVYLELDYKCFQEFTIGLIANATEKQVITLNPSPTWNKIYINLADILNTAPLSSTQKIYFKMVKSSESDDSRFFLDNIKVVHF